MILDLSTLSPTNRLRTSVCIVGGGAAGIAIARAFSRSGVPTCLLEAGGLDPDSRHQSELLGGEFRGTLATQFPNYLTASRLSYFGGSTNHWAGWCRKLDTSDFAARSWMESSGWPIEFDSLEPFYQRAAELVELFPPEGGVSAERARAAEVFSERPLPSFAPDSFILSPPTLFGQVYRAELTDSPAVTLCLNARAIGFTLDDAAADSAQIRSLEVLHESGQRFQIEAERFVLATGGIENARMLLQFAATNAGRGNATDLVGRYFMDHPETTVGFSVIEIAPTALQPYQQYRPLNWSNSCLHTLYLQDFAQQRFGLPNLSVQLTPVDPTIAPREVQELLPLFRKLNPNAPQTVVHQRIRLEPRADRNSRVELLEDRDAAGLPRAAVNWRLNQFDVDSCRRAAELFATELGRSHRARTRLLWDESNPWRYTTYASHHLGTTRMATTEPEGVVDTNCRVFGTRNLFVAGSSVFPSAGVSNPTWTILALSLRLADHLVASFRETP